MSIGNPEVIRLRYAGRCRCGEPLTAGERAGYARAERRVVCLSCLADQPAGRAELGALAQELGPPAEELGPPAEELGPPAPGVAGGAARREYERRVAKRAEALATRGRFVRFANALSGEPQSTRAWEVGARGEEAVAEVLARTAARGSGASRSTGPGQAVEH